MTTPTMSRRSFVAASALTAAAAAAAPVAATAVADEAAAADDPLAADVLVQGETESAATTVEADVVVIGAGPGGISCATRAAELGAKVVVVEKRDSIGGTGLFASGNCYIALNSEYQLAEGLEADIPAFYKEWLEAVHYHCNHDVLGTYLRNCGRVADWLIGYGFEFYMKDVPPTNGLSGNAYRISQPPRDSGVREAAYGAMIDVVTAAGGEVFFNTVAQELIVDAEGAVMGVRAIDADGAQVDFLGKATVIATGGYAANREMVNALCDVPLLGRDPVQNCGEMARAAWAAGAKKPWNLGILCCDTLYPIDREYNSFPGGIQGLGNVMNETGKSRLHVNELGRRFHSEDAFCWVPTYGGANAVANNEPWLYVIADQATIDAFMGAENSTLDQATLDSLIEAGVVATAESPAALSEVMGWDPEVFQTTFDEYNAACAAGVDEKFYKDAQFLVAIEEGPLYAVRYAPTPFGSCGDLDITPKCAVISNERGKLVKNLYAVGTECVGVMHNDYYWALGQTVGWAHTSGVLAAEDIAEDVLA